MITSFAVGGQVIHVTDAESVKIEHRRQCQHPPSTCRFRQSYGPEFFIRVCSAVPSEDEAWKEFRSGYEDIPEADEEEYYVADGHLRHQKCRDWEDGNLDCTQQLDLPTHAKRFGIFRVCRQLSFSAFRSFWTTNTFSFGHASSFGKFLSCLNDTEKMAIRRIDLNIHEFSPQRLAFDPCQIMKLQQLDTLHLCMHSSLLGDVYAMEDINPQISQIDIRKQPGKDILRLEVLDIKHLTVIVYDHESEYTVGDDRFEERFTLDEKRDLAKLVEATLMAPSADRRILAQGDREIFEMEELLRGLRYAQDVRWQTQRGSFQIWSDDPSEDNDHDPAT